MISVIMAAYNEKISELNRAIKSILDQTYSDIELIVICDNPKNKEMQEYLRKISSSDKRLKVYYNEKNIGLAESLNKAIQLTNGEFIARMDADDYSFPVRLEKQLAYIKETNYDLVGALIECVDENGNTIYSMKNMPASNEKVLKKVEFNNPLAHPTWFAKREVFIKNKGYRPVPYAEDYDFILRAILNGFKLGNVSEILFKYTIRETSISKSNGLKQFLISKSLIEKYKNKTISTDTVESICAVLHGVQEEDEKKYAEASEFFAKAVRKAENKNPVFVILILEAFIHSKYYRKKIMGYIKAFL